MIVFAHPVSFRVPLGPRDRQNICRNCDAFVGFVSADFLPIKGPIWGQILIVFSIFRFISGPFRPKRSA